MDCAYFLNLAWDRGQPSTRVPIVGLHKSIFVNTSVFSLKNSSHLIQYISDIMATLGQLFLATTYS